MLDPQVFYNKEDLWALPRRTIEGRDRDMEPYYTIMRLPGEQKEEFILLTLFNPARRDNMIAVDGRALGSPTYGKLIVFNFPKQKLVYGRARSTRGSTRIRSSPSSWPSGTSAARRSSGAPCWRSRSISR